VCLSDETKITWNQSGPAGPQGLPGATGQQGPAGATGQAGPAGVNGQAELLPAVQFGFDNAAGNMFLKLDGVRGESKAANHQGEMEISSFSFGAGNPATSGSGGGGGAGRTSFSSFTITKPVDKSSPLLQLGDLSGKQYKEADVFFARKTDKGQQDYLEIKLEQVLIASYKISKGSGGAPTETIVLDGIKGEATFISGSSGKAVVSLKPENTT
jgi:type VI secretion system secreted protein Hcp